MSVEARFNKAVWLIRNGPPQADSSNEDKLNFYKFYKQVKT
jgi:diazepam-binding inhibitor (GABA receptor modulating acyl-CoA-binding protein)